MRVAKPQRETAMVTSNSLGIKEIALGTTALRTLWGGFKECRDALVPPVPHGLYLFAFHRDDRRIWIAVEI